MPTPQAASERDQVADGPGDDVFVALDVGLVLALLEGIGQHAREVAADGGLLSDDESAAHWGSTISDGVDRRKAGPEKQRSSRQVRARASAGCFSASLPSLLH